jgi:glycosyltransferase involved in cell wall biosynthesis
MAASVSIIIPCYNGAKYIGETLQTVLAQTYSNWECIVVDNASTDRSAELVQKMAAADPRIKYVGLEQKGVSHARNQGIRQSSGTYILPLDADDKIDPTYIEKAVKILEQSKDLKLVYADAVLFDAVNRGWELPDYSYRSLLIENSIYCSALFRKSDFEATAGYNENMVEGFEDWDFWISFLKETDKVYKIPEKLFSYRIRPGSRNNSLDREKQLKLRRQIFENHRATYERYFNNADFIFDYLNLQNELKAIKRSKAYGLGKSVAGIKKLFGK